MISFLLYFLYLLFLEVMFHALNFGSAPVFPVLALANNCLLAALSVILIMLIPKKGKKIVFWIPPAIEFVLFSVQTVYFHIFKQPLQWKAMFLGGGDALTNYYKEALTGVIECIPRFALMLLPLFIWGFIWKKSKFTLPEWNNVHLMRMMVFVVLGLVVRYDTMTIGRVGELDYYEEYTEFFDPITVMRRMGVGVMIERDATFEIENWWYYGNHLAKHEEYTTVSSGNAALDGTKPGSVIAEDKNTEGSEVSQDGTGAGTQEDSNQQDSNQQDSNPQDSNQQDSISKESILKDSTAPYEIYIDFDKLAELSKGTKEKRWLCQYLQQTVPTKRNEYTGMFEGYNLIFLTAEGFSTSAVREDLTPTLYKLANSGFVCTNYYVPLWQTSTSDGEYINSTGLIPDGQFSMKKSGQNHMSYSLPSYFAAQGAKCYAFHNNNLTYYDRHITHPNLGYEFLAAKKGDMSSSQANGKIFPMENPGFWPASDLEMMEGTLPYYMEETRFLTYYMTISGHMNYNFTGNRMSIKNKDAVADLEMSDNAKAYIACQIELDKALELLIQQLDEAGVLDKTVICLSADHYPYAMTEEQYAELSGKDLEVDQEKFRNTLILWNSQMKEPVVVDKACGSMDLIPTLLNLFGMDFDSRMYAGRDIFDDGEGLVIFNDRSFATDTVIFNKKKKTYTWLKEPVEGQESYLNRIKEDVKDRYQFSAFVLRNDYYYLIDQCREPKKENASR